MPPVMAVARRGRPRAPLRRLAAGGAHGGPRRPTCAI